ncbi:MAG: hypothetical protein H7Z72_20440, partial [Bacteroidetes bacterium]|nr:hypothetical protein [Fibrella sp.]
KRTLFQLFNVLMACIVLVSSTGFGLVERSCQMRGKTVYLNLKEAEAKRCAADHRTVSAPAGGVALSNTPCCQDETTYENVDAASSLTQLVAKFLKTLTHTIATGVTAVVAWLIETTFFSDSGASSAVHSLPSPAGRTLLALVQSLLI